MCPPSLVWSADEPTVFSGDANDYEIGPVIGFGSSAMVHVAQYRPSGQRVAIKMVELDLFEGAQIEDLRREIQVMSLCRHEHLLRVLASFVHESRLWIVTPLLSVGSCLEVLRKLYPKGMAEPLIALIIQQALLALDYLHRNGHLHRDVKAGNLLMDEQGTVQLADFGVSATLMDDQRRGIRKGMRKTFVGTPCWMAPEVMEMTAGGYDWRADIWSLGITCMELAMGHAPYAHYPPMKVIYLTLSAPDPPPFDRHGQAHPYSRTFKEFIECCLQRDPAKRPSAEQLLKHSWFKSLKKRSLLVEQIVSRMPSVTESSVEPEPEEQADAEVDWDFDPPEQQKKGRFVISAGEDLTSPVASQAGSQVASTQASTHASSKPASTQSSPSQISPTQALSPVSPQDLAGVNNSTNSGERRGRFERMPSEEMVNVGSGGSANGAAVQEQEEGKRSRFEVTPPLLATVGGGDSSQPMSPVDPSTTRNSLETQATCSRPSRFKINQSVDSNQATIQANKPMMDPAPMFHYRNPSLVGGEWHHLDQMMMVNDMIRQQLVDLKWYLMSHSSQPPRPTNLEAMMREMELLRLENERLRKRE